MRFSHFHHFGILKNSTINLSISILLDSLHPELNRAFFHRFLALFISSHICPHLWKLKNNAITKLFHKAFRKMYTTRPSMIGSPERVKIQRSLVQNLSEIQQRLKILGGFLNIWGVKMPPEVVTTTFWGQNNIKNEISTIKLLRWQIFSKIQQLLKNHYLREVLNIFGG